MRRRLINDEGGYVIVIVLAMLLIGIGLAVTAMATTLDSRALTTRDARVRRAQQAADAGIQAQLYQQSEVDLSTSSYNFNGGPLNLSTSSTARFRWST